MRLRSLACLLCCLCALETRAQAADQEYPGKTWTAANPEETGWSNEGLQAADEVARELGTDAYLVIHNGRLVHEFGDCDRPSNVHSVRKSILSVLFGIHSAKSPLPLDKTLVDLHIDDKERLTRDEKRATVAHLLQSRSGVYHPAAYWSQEAADRLPERGSHGAGEVFKYNNWDFNVLGAVFEKMTGKSVFKSLERDLAKPLDFDDFNASRDTEWVYDRSRSEYPAYEMRMSARDLGRVGLLMARGGRWKDQQIVPEEWLEESITPHSEDTGNKGVGYGYMWWVGLDGVHFGQKLPPPVFSARGNHGQFVVVVPSYDLVVVHKVDSGKAKHAKLKNSDFGKLFASLLAASPWSQASSSRL
jgi:CubicO group peptidase (beta-lactamase class C family)